MIPIKNYDKQLFRFQVIMFLSCILNSISIILFVQISIIIICFAVFHTLSTSQISNSTTFSYTAFNQKISSSKFSNLMGFWGFGVLGFWGA